jgi:LPS-assembly lipoprotein
MRAATSNRIGVALAVLLVSGCGFHLQGRAVLPAVLAAAYLKPHDAQSDFYLSLRSALRASGTSLQDSAGEGAATILILEDGVSEKVLTVSARNIPTAYQLVYTVRISVNANGKELMASEAHTATREYGFDETALLAKGRERDSLTTALAEELVTQVMRRLASL